jgi:hypothetical protein
MNMNKREWENQYLFGLSARSRARPPFVEKFWPRMNANKRE